MRAIWKYRSQASPISMPKGAIPLHVGLQDGTAHMWVEVDPNAEMTDRHFYVAGTGHPVIKPDDIYIGTWMDGSFVWHLYERPQ